MRELKNNDEVQLFEDKKVRTAWDEEKEEWYFSVVDVIAVLTDSPNPNNYWKVLKKRLKDEGNQSVTNCNQLKLKSPKDGKRYKTDVANTEQLLRIIQSVPSPKAEPFKAWLAMVGTERIEETIDPEQAIDRALETYLASGCSQTRRKRSRHCTPGFGSRNRKAGNHFAECQSFPTAYHRYCRGCRHAASSHRKGF